MTDDILDEVSPHPLIRVGDLRASTLEPSVPERFLRGVPDHACIPMPAAATPALSLVADVDSEWEAVAYRNAPIEIQRALRDRRGLIRAFLASDLGRCEPRRRPRS